MLALSTYGRTCFGAALTALVALSSPPPPSPLAPRHAARAEDPPAAKREAEAVVATRPKPSRLVLVTLDGVRWQDALGVVGDSTRRSEPTRMPTLARLVAEKGVSLGGDGCAHEMRASGPNFVSLPGYLELFTGAPTSCTHNACPPVREPTVVDRARAATESREEVAVFSSWSTYGRAVTARREDLVMSAGAVTSELERATKDEPLLAALASGRKHAGHPGWGNYRPDAYTTRAALRYLEVERPRLLVVGLGDADELAHRGDLAGYRRAVREADAFVGALQETLDALGPAGEQTAVLVTTDHGRASTMRDHGARYPESQRVFLAAFGGGIARRGSVCAKAPLRLEHVAGAMSVLLGVDDAPTVGPLAEEILAAPNELRAPSAGPKLARLVP